LENNDGGGGGSGNYNNTAADEQAGTLAPPATELVTELLSRAASPTKCADGRRRRLRLTKLI
jgi:hypothetical protein